MTTRAVFRSAEDLYSQLPVRDVVRVLAKTKEDAEKREELRDLVGRRYHDLIDSADAIINMNDTVVGFERTLVTIESSASLLLSDLSKNEINGQKKKVNDKNNNNKIITNSPRSAGTSLNEQYHIDLLLRAPTEIWSALDENDELRAAKLYLQVQESVKILKLNNNNVKQKVAIDQTTLEILQKAGKELELSDEMFEICLNLVSKAREDGELCGEWQLKFPFLLSQSRLLLNECRNDIVRTCSLAFSERQISASRVERVMEALLLLGEISNPLKSLLEARSKALKNLIPGDEDSVFGIAELASRTVRDCSWMKIRFPKEVLASKEDLDLNYWIDEIASPVAKNCADILCSKINSVASLATIQRSIKESIKRTETNNKSNQETTTTIEDTATTTTLFEKLFGLSFQDRASFLLSSSHDTTLKQVKRILNSIGNNIEQRNDLAYQSFENLKKGLNSVDRDAAELGQNRFALSKAWLSDLTAWLEQRPTPINARFSEWLIFYLQNENENEKNNEIKNRLMELNKIAIQCWVDLLISRLSDELDTRAEQLPWSKEGRAGSSVLGGWTVDEIHGDLPSVASWPVAEYCFAIARELDLFTDSNHRGTVCNESDERVRKLVGELAWKKAHTIYSRYAKDSSGGADGKLQAAFDLEYCAAALLENGRTLLPFTHGGVDVYACAEILKKRAKLFASSSRLLHSSWISKSTSNNNETNTVVHETKVGGHNLLTLIEPVPRFALLPVPQKRSASPRMFHRHSSQTSLGSDSDITNSNSATKTNKSSTASGGLGSRVLGWLS